MFVFGDWRIALVVLGLFPVMAVCLGVAMATMMDVQKKGAADDGKDEEKTAGSLVGEVVSAIRTVQSFNAEQHLYRDYCAQVDAARDAAVGRALKGGLFTGFAFGMIYLIMGVELLYGFYLSSVGAFSVADEWDADGCKTSDAAAYLNRIMVPIMSLQMCMMQMAMVAALATDGQAASAAAAMLFHRLDRPSQRDPFDEAGEVLPAIRGEIEARDVVFAYPTRTAFPICKGYSLKIEAGTTCALCGPSGSGKSTIIALLQRFYDPQAGSITIDGHGVTTLNLKWLRAQIGMVGQEPLLFDGTVFENIALGKVGEASRAEVEEAARSANAHGFITEDLGEGYDTQVGLRGGMLSGGQKQRVAIARALVRKPSIMLLDEATSALDNESEKVVQAALDEIMAKQKRTTITIAHRLSTIRSADQICVVSSGKVVEHGTHEQLLRIGPKGVYFGLVQASSDAS